MPSAVHHSGKAISKPPTAMPDRLRPERRFGPVSPDRRRLQGPRSTRLRVSGSVAPAQPASVAASRIIMTRPVCSADSRRRRRARSSHLKEACLKRFSWKRATPRLPGLHSSTVSRVATLARPREVFVPEWSTPCGAHTAPGLPTRCCFIRGARTAGRCQTVGDRRVSSDDFDQALGRAAALPSAALHSPRVRRISRASLARCGAVDPRYRFI